MRTLPPSKLLALKKAIGAALKTSGLVAEVHPFANLLKAEDLSAISVATPAAFISVLAAPGGQALHDGTEKVQVDVGIAIVAKGILGATADEQSLAIAEAIYSLSAWQQWGMDGVWPAQNRRMEMMAVPGRTGLALDAVRWSHGVLIGTPYPNGDRAIREDLRPDQPPDLVFRKEGVVDE